MEKDNRKAVECIINSLLSQDIERSTYFKSSLRRIATWSDPYADYAFLDADSGKTIAVVFCNDNLDEEVYKKRIITVLNSYNAVIAAFDVQHLAESNYLCEELKSERLITLPIGIVVFDDSGKVLPIQKFSVPENLATERTQKQQKSYWCWWRDSSHFEVATLLELSYKYDHEDGDIYTNLVYNEFFNLMVEG